MHQLKQRLLNLDPGNATGWYEPQGHPRSTVIAPRPPYLGDCAGFSLKARQDWFLQELRPGGRHEFFSEKDFMSAQNASKPLSSHVARYMYTENRLSTGRKSEDILQIIRALRTEYALTNPVNLVVITASSVGAAATALAGCYGLNSKVMRHRRLPWLSVRLANYEKKFKKLYAR